MYAFEPTQDMHCLYGSSRCNRRAGCVSTLQRFSQVGQTEGMQERANQAAQSVKGAIMVRCVGDTKQPRTSSSHGYMHWRRPFELDKPTLDRSTIYFVAAVIGLHAIRHPMHDRRDGIDDLCACAASVCFARVCLSSCELCSCEVRSILI